MPRKEPLPHSFSRVSFSVETAQNAGISRGRLRSAELARPFYGVRSPATASGGSDNFGGFGGSGGSDGSVLARCQALATRMPPGQFFSHLTAARLWGVPLPTRFSASEKLHVSSFAPQRPPRMRGVIGHELRPASAAVVTRCGLLVADPASTWVQLASLLSPTELVVSADHFVLDPYLLDPHDPRPFTSVAALAERLEQYRGRGKRAAMVALDRARTGAESRPETLLRLLLVDAGLPEPLVNVTLRKADGRFLARVDLVYPEWRVAIEYDGDQHRESTQQYDADMYRRESVAQAGWDVVYVRSRGLFMTPERTVERVRAALQRAGWTP